MLKNDSNINYFIFKMILDDIDLQIIRLLNYRDMISLCQTNTKFYQLCQKDNIIQDKIQFAFNKANAIIDMRRPSLYLNPKRFDTVDHFMSIINYLHIGIDNNIQDIVYIYISICNIDNDDFGIMFEDRFLNQYFTDVKSIEQLNQFLIHCYYDDLILIL